MPSCRLAACTGASCCAAAPKKARLAPVWPGMPMQSRTWHAHRLRVRLKPRCKCLLGAVCKRGDQVPLNGASMDPKFPHLAQPAPGMPGATGLQRHT